MVQPSTLRSVFARPTPRRLLVASPFVAVTIVLVAMAIFFMDLLSAARAYVGGESLWTKGQKEAVQHLERYAQTRAEASWHAYSQAIAVPLGDRIAREELEKPSPDYGVARRGFIAGANHEDDIDGMIRLFRWFRRASFIDEAIRIWAEADGLIAQLTDTAEQLHRAVQANAGADALSPLVQRIEDLD
ncbi:MAG TPA: GGDEF domain-containing protein, partial [Burkholderiaceae bacterium]